MEGHDLGSYFTNPQFSRHATRYREAFKHLLLLPEVVRIKAWDRQATVLWSDDKQLIGKRFPENPEVKEALAGRIAVKLKTLPKAQDEYGRERFPRLAEVFVPIHSKTSAEIIGVVANPWAEERKAPSGFTADILAETTDGARRFGFEVTGTNGPIKKDSKKLTQVLDFERIKEHGEKTVLVANTHNTRSIEERETLEHFTQPVVEFLSPYPILLMTGWDLYRMVGDVLAGTKSAEDIVTLLHEKRGVLSY